MKYLFLNIVFMVLSIQDCTAIFTSKQVNIPIDNIDGMFLDRNDDNYVNGFAVDSLENFYFCCGKEEHYVSCFSSEGEKRFSQKLPFLSLGPMFLKHNYLYLYTICGKKSILKQYSV